MILKAKIENAAAIDQEGRNDVKHVRMMILCTRAFIVEFCAIVRDGNASGRALVNILEETFAIVCSPNAQKAATLWDFDFKMIWPIEELKTCGGEKVARWLEHRLG